MEERGQIQLSFGMIFSIIIIIATIGVTFYIIAQFMKTSNCAGDALVQKSLQDEIDRAWNSAIYNGRFTFNEVRAKEICFGNPLAYNASYKTEAEALQKYNKNGANLFIYPPSAACDNTRAAYKLEHVNITQFFCSKIIGGKGRVSLEKEDTDALVIMRS